ncbi:hypothetical protein [Pseudomonas viridiflava]|uniref:hypothetical protein n=1 Tax=Pseudomonas viridiflava TaxID=33069 RepID=UPI0020C0ADF3|nr:hypothetical protein [Pseudomonas viridiflava]MEE4139258.1 hypothetical protein [Pseudomonas viridiflava]
MKPKVDPAALEITVSKSSPRQVRFRDKVFTSRTLPLPSGNLLHVIAGTVDVSDDSEGFSLLNTHPEFEPLE